MLGSLRAQLTGFGRAHGNHVVAPAIQPPSRRYSGNCYHTIRVHSGSCCPTSRGQSEQASAACCSLSPFISADLLSTSQELVEIVYSTQNHTARLGFQCSFSCFLLPNEVFFFFFLPSVVPLQASLSTALNSDCTALLIPTGAPSFLPKTRPEFRSSGPPKAPADSTKRAPQLILCPRISVSGSSARVSGSPNY